IDDMRKVKGQFLEVDFLKFQTQIAVKKPLDNRLKAFFFLPFQFNKSQANHVIDQTFNISFNNMKEGTDQFGLKLHGDSTYHTKIEKGEPPIIHYAQIAR